MTELEYYLVKTALTLGVRPATISRDMELSMTAVTIAQGCDTYEQFEQMASPEGYAELQRALFNA
ncbi:MAG TPA: hypothetical protein VFH39_04555 [Candidatus Saccharimonadales bacterium]|nr:hypothetical protein [Candidatus Saccharimonadales bacterium]